MKRIHFTRAQVIKNLEEITQKGIRPFIASLTYLYIINWLIKISISASKLVHNVLALGAEGDLEALNCQYALKLNRSRNFQFCSSTPIVPNACYRAFFFSSCPYVPSYAV